jgi:hypothetical protein
MKNLDKYVNDSYRLSLDECFGTWIHNGVWQSDIFGEYVLNISNNIF